jgi:hypothetical protein
MNQERKAWHSKHTQTTGHTFTPDPRNDFVCELCSLPRWQHASDGFVVGGAEAIPIDDRHEHDSAQD